MAKKNNKPNTSKAYKNKDVPIKNEDKVITSSRWGADFEAAKKILLEIIEIYATSSKPIHKILTDGIEAGKNYPVYSTFYKYKKLDSEIADIYTQAIERHDAFMAYETIEIADNKSEDFTQNSKGQMVFDKEHVRRSDLRVNTRFRLLDYLKGVRERDNKDPTTMPQTVMNFYPSSMKPKEEKV